MKPVARVLVLLVSLVLISLSAWDLNQRLFGPWDPDQRAVSASQSWLDGTFGRGHSRLSVENVEKGPLQAVLVHDLSPDDARLAGLGIQELLHVDASRGDRLTVVRGRVRGPNLDGFLAPLAALVGVLLLALGLRPRGKRNARSAPQVPCARQGKAEGGCSSSIPLTPRQQAAVVLMSYPPQISAQIFKELGPDLVEGITLEICKLPQLTPEMREECLRAFDVRRREVCASACGKECCPAQTAAAILRLYCAAPAPAAPAAPRRRRQTFQCPDCDEVFVDEDSLRVHRRQHGASGQTEPAARAGVRPAAVRPVTRALSPRRILVGASLACLLAAVPFVAILESARVSILSGRIGAERVVTASLERDGQQTVVSTALGLDESDCARLQPLLAERYGPNVRAFLHGRRAPSVSWPWAPGLGVGLLALTLWAGYGLRLRRKREQIPAAPDSSPMESVLRLKQVDVLELQVGRGLLSLVDPNQGARLLQRVTSIRRHIATELGLVVPGIRFRDNLQLTVNRYVICLRGVEVASGAVEVNQFLAIGPESKLGTLRGKRTTDPTYGMPGVWISPEQRGDAERLGCMIFDPVSVIATQLTEVIRCHAADLLSRDDTSELLDALAKQHPVLVAETRGTLPLVTVQKVLRNLLDERVSIRDLALILEELTASWSCTRDADLLTEMVRPALGRSICAEWVNQHGEILALTLDSAWESALEQALEETERGFVVRLEPSLETRLLESIGELKEEQFRQRGWTCVIVTSPAARPALRRLLKSVHPEVVVLSWSDIQPRVRIDCLATLTLL